MTSNRKKYYRKGKVRECCGYTLSLVSHFTCFCE